MQPTTAPEPLLSLRVTLDQYRSAGKRAVFPDAVKQQAVALLNDYSAAAINEALGLSSSSLSRWRRQGNPVKTDPAHTDHNEKFVALPLAEPDLTHKHTLSIVLNRTGSDQRVTFNGEVTLDQWRDLLQQITKAALS